MTVDFQVADARPQMPLDATLFHQWVFPDGTLWTDFYRIGGAYLLRFPELADFQLSQDGGQIQAWPVQGVSGATIQHLYLNQVLPLALSKQGKLVLHGSAVEISGEGIAFIGESGRGKSTLAASFATDGFRFLTDDGLLVEPCDGGFQIMPSHPSIRLWEDSEEALVGKDGVRKAPPVQFTSKARFLAGDEIAFCGQPRRLRHVYFLGEGVQQEAVFEGMTGREALMELMKHSFLLEIEAHELLAAHFDELSSLAGQPIFYRLDYPRRFEDLPRVRQAIVKHAFKVGEQA
ncbi:MULTISPECIES: hypothetical protein [unclassified Mesorhizobium]|uniref:hypothetical protein n=1 Tax=unclassified Mesorhizobium TaxID=325217 RepID=UPI000FD27ACA|nr:MULTISPECIES: hypothetical protein [unclassified Mesorhizobium]RVB80659.1 hypothetical protein EN885_01970 [Mesorhizobium sp. M6A.T.Cr.TU.014.01.1.1]RWQ06517.1 MAG: hypothetical protein EOR91_13895 [Mesorhizobium sp.]RWQ10754.1 MAG: hypothetical protein EOR90_02960 [Mesorhizobium sp.]